MNCAEANRLFDEALAEPDGGARRRLMQHLSACADCRHAFRALAYLRAERGRPGPEPPVGAAEEAVRAAVESGRGHPSSAFWSGVVVGVLATALTLLVTWLVLGSIGVEGILQ